MPQFPQVQSEDDPSHLPTAGVRVQTHCPDSSHTKIYIKVLNSPYVLRPSGSCTSCPLCLELPFSALGTCEWLRFTYSLGPNSNTSSSGKLSWPTQHRGAWLPCASRYQCAACSTSFSEHACHIEPQLHLYNMSLVLESMDHACLPATSTALCTKQALKTYLLNEQIHTEGVGTDKPQTLIGDGLPCWHCRPGFQHKGKSL